MNTIHNTVTKETKKTKKTETQSRAAGLMFHIKKAQMLDNTVFDGICGLASASKHIFIC